MNQSFLFKISGFQLMLQNAFPYTPKSLTTLTSGGWECGGLGRMLMLWDLYICVMFVFIIKSMLYYTTFIFKT